jgi:prepilin-type N-terminal cleavage/methylation domain-containing protein
MRARGATSRPPEAGRRRLGARRAGFTLIELLLALGVFSILVLAILRLLDTSLGIWGRTESSRDLFEASSSVFELLSSDLRALEGGRRGDLVGDWTVFDTDRDGTRGAPMMRLRLVRQASPAERLAAPSAEAGRELDCLETCWALLPPREADADHRSIAVLWRGSRPLGEPGTTSFLSPAFFDAAGRPAPGSLSGVIGGVLWFEAWFASSTSVLREGWKLGDELADCAESWDAWGRGRPDPELARANRAPAAAVRPGDLPVLPRRVRLALELERESDLKRRTRLARDLDPEATALSVLDVDRLPAQGAFLLVDEEWMRLVSVAGGEARVERGARGTSPTAHAARRIVHHGQRVEREVPLPVLREEWLR